MAITAATKTSDFSGFLPPHMASGYFDEVLKKSVVQQLARKVPLSISGETVPIVTSKPVAGWVAEGDQKPTTKGTLSLLQMAPKKIAAIAVVSMEVVRANPGNYVQLFKDDIAEAFAMAFDAAVLHGTNSPFGHNLDETTKSVELGTATADKGGIYADLNSAIALLVADGKKATGWAFDVKAEPLLNASVDTNGRPLLVDPVYSESTLTTARLLGRGVDLGEGVATADGKAVTGYTGDWSKVVWGSVGGISYDVSDQAAVTVNGELTSTWENNLVAIRAEAEFGALIADTGAFVKLTNAA